MIDLNFSLAIVAITCIVSLRAFKDQTLLRKWIFYPYRVKHNKEYWRFLTSGFLHGGLAHLAINMFVLW